MMTALLECFNETCMVVPLAKYIGIVMKFYGFQISLTWTSKATEKAVIIVKIATCT